MKFKTPFMSGEEKHGHHFDLPLFFNMSKNFLVPGRLSAECVQVGVMESAVKTFGAQGDGPQGLRSSKCSKLIFGNVIVDIGTNKTKQNKRQFFGQK